MKILDNEVLELIVGGADIAHTDNGNGNNIDGVDASNPGQGLGGPNGEADPSGGVDDEIK